MNPIRHTLSAKPHAVATAVLIVASSSAWSQSTPTTPAAADEVKKQETIIVTGSRLKSEAITATSPVSQLSAAEIALTRALTVEEFSTKLPQLAGGVNSTAVGSDAFGAQTLDLRALGQNRTLVLINGTRAVPFSFRNAVDVNQVPAPLLRRVDILTGGAAAIYGADAMSGVVNFIINDGLRGLQVGLNHKSPSGGGKQTGVHATGGISLGGRGSLVGYLEVTDRDELLAGERAWALPNQARIAGNGGNFTDVASGRTFSFDAAGNLSTAPQTTDYTSQLLLVQPLKRTNASLFGRYDITDNVQAYGRAMFSGVETQGASRSGQQPVVVNDVYNIGSTNQFLTPAIRNLLTFNANGVAQVRINRSLGELGPVRATNDRETNQFQLGLRGSLTPNLEWDAYAQTGSTTEDVLITGDASKAAFAANVNNIDLFGPGANLSSVAQDFSYGQRKRTQNVYGLSLSGDTSDFFKAPAGPIGLALGAEIRREKGRFDYNPNLNQSFAQGLESGPPVPPFFNAKDFYVEARLPLLKNAAFAKSLALELAYRSSETQKSVGADNSDDSSKLGLSWAINDDLRLRTTAQTTVRAPNFGEFANPQSSIPFRNLRTVARLNPRYQGDPCALGTGDAAQCARFGAPAVGAYDSRDPNLLTGQYIFGGNPNIKAEKGKSATLGLVLTPRALPGLSATFDFYDIQITDAVGVIQPVDALTSCYITDPRADNPLCAAVTRDPATGRIKDGLPIDRNLASIKQRGVDVDLAYNRAVNAGFFGTLNLRYQASFVTDYTIQRSPVLTPLDCKGTYGSACSSDSVSLVAPDYRHRVSLANTFGNLTAEIGWKRIGKVRDSAAGSTDTISAQDYFDLNASYRVPQIKGLTVNVGIDNINGKKPPTPRNAALFNTYPDTYNVLGRVLGFSVTYKAF